MTLSDASRLGRAAAAVDELTIRLAVEEAILNYSKVPVQPHEALRWVVGDTVDVRDLAELGAGVYNQARIQRSELGAVHAALDMWLYGFMLGVVFERDDA